MNARTKVHGATDQAPTWKAELIELIATKGRSTAPQKGRTKPVSLRTVDARQRLLFLCFKQLGALGFKIRSLDGFGERHVRALAEEWERTGLSSASIQNRLSALRTLAEWLGKSAMVKESKCYVTDPKSVRRSTNATYDHSWTAAGVDVERVLGMVESVDPYVGIQLRLCHAFFLRREEAVMFRPHRADKGDTIEVLDGTKGGRIRTVPILTDYQRSVLELAKQRVVGKNGHVGQPGRDLIQALNRFNYVVRKCGVSKAGLGITAHGLRHQGLNDTFEAIAGVPSPIRTANPAQVFALADPERVEHARAVVSECAGHSRLSISGSYIGGLKGRNVELSPAQRRHMEHWTRFFELHGRQLLTEMERLEKARLFRILKLDEAAQEAVVALPGADTAAVNPG